MEKSESVANLIQFVVDSVRQAHAGDAPFHHLQFERIFPDDFYAHMVEAMPVAEDYRAMSGKSKMGSSRSDGKPTRTKIDLFPEYIRHLPPKNAQSGMRRAACCARRSCNLLSFNGWRQG